MSAQPLPVPASGDDAAHAGMGRSVPADGAGSGAAPSIPHLARLLEGSQEFKTLAGLEWSGLSHEDAKAAIKALELVSRATMAIQSRVLETLSDSGSWSRDGERSLDAWVTTTTGTTRTTASKSVKLAKSMKEDLPGTREALAKGEISTDHARIISQQCTATEKQRARLADPDHGEALLLEKARQMNAGEFFKFATGWRIETDPQAADRKYRQDKSKRDFTLTPTEEGYRASGWFTHVDGTLLKEAFKSHMGIKAQNDPRSFNERQADALLALAAQSLDAGLQMPHARVRPHLIVTMDHHTIEKLIDASGPIIPESLGGSGAPVDESTWAQQWRHGDDHVISTSLDYTKLEGIPAATLAGGLPINPSTLARLACNSLFSRVIFGPKSVILNAGREERIFTTGQTRAIIARDQTCRYPGCDEGPGFGEIHHSISWAKHNGRTDVDLGILLCYHHHDVVHQQHISILRRDGAWIFIDRHGRHITTPGHRFTPLDPAAHLDPVAHLDPATVHPESSSTGASVSKTGYTPSPASKNPRASDNGGSVPSSRGAPDRPPGEWHQPGIFPEGPPPF